MNKTIKIGKKGGAKRIANEITEIRKTPLLQEVFDILKNFSKNNKQTDKNSAKSLTDLGT